MRLKKRFRFLIVVVATAIFGAAFFQNCSGGFSVENLATPAGIVGTGGSGSSINDSPGAAVCLFDGKIVAEGDSVLAYSVSNVPSGQTCMPQSRNCKDGSLSGSAKYSSCSVGKAMACLFNGVTIQDGDSVKAWQASTVSTGQICISDFRICQNGVLSGSFLFPSCAVNSPAMCLFNGNAIASGQSLKAFQASTVPSGNVCISETRSCANGTLSGTLTYENCRVVPKLPVTVCQTGDVCPMDPLTTKPMTATVLMSLEDTTNTKIVSVGDATIQMIAETLIRLVSPVPNPRVLIVIAAIQYNRYPAVLTSIKDNLLQKFAPTQIAESSQGLSDADVAGYDVVWFANPTYYMTSLKTRDTLLKFTGGVILDGDDLSQPVSPVNSPGTNSQGQLDALTGLHNPGLSMLDNGTYVTCGGILYVTDVNQSGDPNGYSYNTVLDPKFFANSDMSAITINYRNDIDLATVVDPTKTQVLATARGGPGFCSDPRPAITLRTRY